MRILPHQLHPLTSKHNRLGNAARYVMGFAIILTVAVVLLDNLDQRKEVARLKWIVADQLNVIEHLDTALDGRAVWVEDLYEIRCKKRKRPVYVLAPKEVE